MLTKGAIGNLVNRYKAVLKKCNLINTFGSLAVASMLVMGGAGVASAANPTIVEGSGEFSYTDNDIIFVIGDNEKVAYTSNGELCTTDIPSGTTSKIALNAGNRSIRFDTTNKSSLTADTIILKSSDIYMDSDDSINGKNITINSIQSGNGGSITAEESITFNSYSKSNSLHISAPVFISEGAFDLREDTVIEAEEIKAKSNLNVYDNTSFSSDLSRVTLQDKARLQLLGSNTMAFDTLIVEGAGTKLVDRMPGSQKDRTSFYIANVELAKESKLDVYADDNAEGGSIRFDNVSLKENAKLNLGWRSDGGYEGTLDKKDIDTIRLESGAKVVAFDGDSPSGSPQVTDSNCGAFNVKNIIFAGSGSSIQAEVTGDSTDITLKDGVEDASISKLSAKKASVTVKNPNNSTLAISEVAEGSSVEVTTGKEHNTGDLSTLAKAVTVETSNGTVTASIAENDIYGAVSGTLGENGTVSEVKQARNTLMDAALKQASVTTIALDKILTNDVRKRLGDIRSDKNTTGVWMRWDGGKLKGDGLTNDFNTLQIGGDTKVGKNCRIGVAGSFTHGEADFARGNAELEGFSFALYSTWMGENGMFADVVARIGHFSNEMKVEGREGDMNNRVASLSGEYGWRFNVCEQFFVEPQIELAYTYVSSEDLELGAAKYEFDSVDSLTGRAGVVFGWNLPNDRGNIYARASVLQQFMGDAKITGTNGSAYNVQKLDGEDTWLEYGIGANVKLTDSTYIWADVERTEGADIEEEWRGTVGIRYSF